ncbi:MAG: hypothetical protein KDB88_03415 [Flavobacteriales bacterium]|nr:hypothetical protein [Flavobacteriales bacterium]
MSSHGVASPEAKGKVRWLKRLGWAGFLFFFVKGLVWLAIFLGVGKLFS